MIHLLHGSDVEASYNRLRELVSGYGGWDKVYVVDLENLNLELYTGDLFSTKKIVIAEDITSFKNLKVENIKNIPQNRILVIWEKKELTASQFSKFSKIASVENLKLPSTLFYFLDSISTQDKKPFVILKKLQIEKASSLTWHLANRFYMLLLAKLNLDEKKAGKIIGRNIAPWQWQKIKHQAASFDFEKLKALLAASLKVETIVRTGKTDMPEATMVSLMLAKHLAN